MVMPYWIWNLQVMNLLLIFSGAGLLKLQDDIQTCGYQDVQVMWEMLSRTESESKSPQTKRKQRSLWRIFAWTNQSTTSSFSAEYAQ
ncbi:hypothetical protein LIER_05655 [Lithospermum erythrorhizon]|uniref:Uncharacterized protein n=1 Tax=Lithospermum erythrorhizon TaxID=34254 RepID=A0AAV3P2X6_LITER